MNSKDVRPAGLVVRDWENNIIGDKDETTFNLETKVENAINPHEMPGIKYETPETTEEYSVGEDMDNNCRQC